MKCLNYKVCRVYISFSDSTRIILFLSQRNKRNLRNPRRDCESLLRRDQIVISIELLSPITHTHIHMCIHMHEHTHTKVW